MVIEKKDLEKMSFIDFSVTETNIDKILKTISFSLNGAFLILDSRKLELGPGYLKITRYDSIIISSYNAREKLEHNLTLDTYEPLREICEINVNGNQIIIKGFANITSNWIEFSVTGGTLEGKFSEN